MKIEYQPIGTIHSTFTEPTGMPIQPAGALGIQGTVEIFPEYRAGLQDLDGFSHIILLYHFHRSHGFDLRVIPFMDTEPRGLFATRAPNRPNALGLSVVKLLDIQGCTLPIANVDILDGTPLLDIK
ncbi:tRNA (N6-threonylcarbamoyladenosine(37)-N6)-methyltransferase TrmO [Methylococcus sp. ANG]|uniref:tRNA (N6-threonylcarbamoyladenosine(37)-N6)-methyltransferase TrmO n=1 Tax=Methylococcus sp. ANG TaxID=3231903 RepID=UPI0034599011